MTEALNFSKRCLTSVIHSYRFIHIQFPLVDDCCCRNKTIQDLHLLVNTIPNIDSVSAVSVSAAILFALENLKLTMLAFPFKLNGFEISRLDTLCFWMVPSS